MKRLTEIGEGELLAGGDDGTVDRPDAERLRERLRKLFSQEPMTTEDVIRDAVTNAFGPFGVVYKYPEASAALAPPIFGKLLKHFYRPALHRPLRDIGKRDY